MRRLRRPDSEAAGRKKILPIVVSGEGLQQAQLSAGATGARALTASALTAGAGRAGRDPKGTQPRGGDPLGYLVTSRLTLHPELKDN
jgi:hypothetical protein